MHPICALIMALGMCPSLIAAAEVPPKVPETPHSPGQIHPIYPNPKPLVIPPPDGVRMPQVPNQAQLESNMEHLEQRLENVNEFVDKAKEVVEAILPTTSEATTLIIPDATTTDVTFTPTTVLPSESYSACLSYAVILSSCAQGTDSFYSLNPTAQASCACYSTTTSDAPCPSDSGTINALVRKLDENRFDNAANACHKFFDLQGYSNAANATSGQDGNRTALGAGFCANVNEQLKTSNRTSGLEASPTPIPSGLCIMPPTSTASGGSSISGFTAFDRAIFSTFPVVMVLFSYLLFL